MGRMPGRNLRHHPVSGHDVQDIQILHDRRRQGGPASAFSLFNVVSTHLGVSGSEGNKSLEAIGDRILGKVSAILLQLEIGLRRDLLVEGQFQATVQDRSFGVKDMSSTVLFRHALFRLAFGKLASFYSLKWTSRARRPSSVRAPWGEMPARLRAYEPCSSPAPGMSNESVPASPSFWLDAVTVWVQIRLPCGSYRSTAYDVYTGCWGRSIRITAPCLRSAWTTVGSAPRV